MEGENNTQQFNEAKLRYLIQDHYTDDDEKNRLIKALNSFKTNFENGSDDDKKQIFYVGKDILLHMFKQVIINLMVKLLVFIMQT